MDFRRSIPQKGTSVGHFSARDDQTIRISKFFEDKAVEVGEASEVAKADKVNEASEVSKAWKSLLHTSRSYYWKIVSNFVAFS